jgi:cytochrome c-type biogenesis protein CcmH
VSLLLKLRVLRVKLALTLTRYRIKGWQTRGWSAFADHDGESVATLRTKGRRLASLVLLPLLLSFLLATAALAVEPSEMLKDPALEARARSISRELRCLVCQNQSIDESNADLAHDLRLIVRERLTAGDSDDQVRAFLVARYGDFVLLDPPFKAKTLLLWCGPAVLLLIGAGGIYALLRRRPTGATEPLSDAERSRLAELMVENAEAPLGGREPGQG